MRCSTSKRVALVFLLSITVVAFCGMSGQSLFAQEGGEAYTATAIASEGTTGDITGRMVIRIASYTSESEKKNLVEAFKKNSGEGVALLRSMTKGYINIEGKPGRKILAAFARDRQDGREIILVGEHVASILEKSRNVKVEEHPLAVISLRFGTDGTPIAGEIFPALKLTITPDGFPDVQTGSTNQIKLYDIARR